MKKKILLALLAVLVILQFFQTEKNDSPIVVENTVEAIVETPLDVQELLVLACNDCHSNKTNHMWYESIQPLGWWIADHIHEGKEELNFSEFASYSTKKQIHKLDEVIEMIEDGEMPLESYTYVHGEAKLNPQQKDKLIDWAKNGMKLLSK